MRAALLAAYDERVDVDTAARHLWRLHHTPLPPVPRRHMVARSLARHRLMAAAALVAALLLVAPGLAATLRNGPSAQDPTDGLPPGRTVAADVPTAVRAHLLLNYVEDRLDRARLASLNEPEVVPRLVDEAVDTLLYVEQLDRSLEVAARAEQVRERARAEVAALAAEAGEEVRAMLAGSARRLLPPEEDGTGSVPRNKDGASPSPDDTPHPTPSPAATPAPTVSPSPSPTASPSPTPTASPSPTASPTPSPSPSTTAEPTPGPATATPTPTPEPVLDDGTSQEDGDDMSTKPARKTPDAG